ncbi:hypothetical protein IT570_04370 [Candidatus Sumerlaeota bacterium]|nr:hypothetical protein [Candidatus Sumerlaeota bacterium]
MKDRILTTILVGAYLMLMLDIRFEHRRHMEDPQPWIPIVYSMFMVLVGGTCLALWKKNWARYVLAGIFVGSMVVGLLGVWFHIDEGLMQDVKQLFSVWESNQNPGIGLRPPLLAPLSFVGLGIVGVILSWPRRN